MRLKPPTSRKKTISSGTRVRIIPTSFTPVHLPTPEATRYATAQRGDPLCARNAIPSPSPPPPFRRTTNGATTHPTRVYSVNTRCPPPRIPISQSTISFSSRYVKTGRKSKQTRVTRPRTREKTYQTTREDVASHNVDKSRST